MVSVKQELRQKIWQTLEVVKNLPPEAGQCAIRERLLAIQRDCQSVQKTFIFVEERILCNQYDLGGYAGDTATLFRGPNEDASVAICLTDRGSLLHRNGCPWQVYRNAGDINPIKANLHKRAELLPVAQRRDILPSHSRKMPGELSV